LRIPEEGTPPHPDTEEDLEYTGRVRILEADGVEELNIN